MKKPLTPYQKRLFVFLSVATFFEGYDFQALGQILPNLRAEMGLSEAVGGQLVSAISIGTMLAYFLVRLADRWGRRRVLTITILGYASFTFFTGFSQSPYDFAFFQFCARIFLIAEWTLSMVFAAEEFPADRRGFVIGVIQAATAFGAIICAAMVPLLLQTAYGWRTVYLVGVIPLLLLAYARRGLKETERFSHYAAKRPTTKRRFFAIFHTAHKKRVLQMALIWGLTYMCTQPAVIFWKEFAVNERGFTDGQVGLAVAVASLGALPLVFFVGKLIDEWGRRRGAILIYLAMALSVVPAYQLRNFWALTVSLMVAIFAAVALLTLLNTFTTELFPTEIRGDAFAWSNNFLGRIGYVIAPAIVGAAAGQIGWGNAVSVTAVFVLAALMLILWLLPETSKMELEETAAV